MTVQPLVFTSLVVGLVPVVPWVLAPLPSSLVGLESLLSILSMANPEMIHFFLEKVRFIADCSASCLTMVSKEGMAASSLLSFTVNIMAGSALVMSSRKFCLCFSFWMTHDTAHKLALEREISIMKAVFQ